jgi:hypothetical protein
LGVTLTATYVYGQPHYYGEGYNTASLAISSGASVSAAGAITADDSTISVTGAGSSLESAGVMSLSSEPDSFVSGDALEATDRGAIQVGGLVLEQLSTLTGTNYGLTVDVDGTSSIECGNGGRRRNGDRVRDEYAHDHRHATGGQCRPGDV